MSRRTRRNHSPTFKPKVALSAHSKLKLRVLAADAGHECRSSFGRDNVHNLAGSASPILRQCCAGTEIL